MVAPAQVNSFNGSSRTIRSPDFLSPVVNFASRAREYIPTLENCSWIIFYSVELVHRTNNEFVNINKECYRLGRAAGCVDNAVAMDTTPHHLSTSPPRRHETTPTTKLHYIIYIIMLYYLPAPHPPSSSLSSIFSRLPVRVRRRRKGLRGGRVPSPFLYTDPTNTGHNLFTTIIVNSVYALYLE